LATAISPAAQRGGGKGGKASGKACKATGKGGMAGGEVSNRRRRGRRRPAALAEKAGGAGGYGRRCGRRWPAAPAVCLAAREATAGGAGGLPRGAGHFPGSYLRKRYWLTPRYQHRRPRSDGGGRRQRQRRGARA